MPEARKRHGYIKGPSVAGCIRRMQKEGMRTNRMLEGAGRRHEGNAPSMMAARGGAWRPRRGASSEATVSASEESSRVEWEEHSEKREKGRR